MAPFNDPHELLTIPPPSLSAVKAAKSAAMKPTFCPPPLNFHSPSSLSHSQSTSATAPADAPSSASDPFLHAIHIRKRVFVDEQRCSLENEIDDEDAQSWHFVILARPPSLPKEDSAGVDVAGEKNGAEPEEQEKGIAAATVRLVLVRPHAHTHASGNSDKGEHPLAPPTTATDSQDSTTLPSEPDMHSSTVWDGQELYVKIGRLATLKEFRGRRFGKILVEAVVEYARLHPREMVLPDGPGAQGERVNGESKGVGKEQEAAQWAGKGWKGLICAHAQKDVVRFYEGCGFEVDEGMGRFWEEGIEHVGVWRRVEVG